jgi:hypothetical protein
VSKSATLNDLIDQYNKTFTKDHGRTKVATRTMIKRELGNVKQERSTG